MTGMRVAYATFEQAVIALYNRRELTIDVLDTLACRYRGMHVDSAGSNRLSTNDGRDMHQVCIALVNPAFPLVAHRSCDDDEAYWEEELKEWSHITTFRWGWNTSRSLSRSSFSGERAVKALLPV